MGSDRAFRKNLAHFCAQGDDEISAERALEVQDVMRVMRECCQVLREVGRGDLAARVAAIFGLR